MAADYKTMRQGTLQRLRILGALLVIGVSVLAGCASLDSNKQEQVVQEAPEPQGPIVARFEDGREGFFIRELPVMDEAVRSDFEEAVALLNDAQYEAAAALLEQVVAQAPGLTAPYIDLAIAYRQVGRLEQAETQLKKALELIPDHPVACNLYGLLYRESGRFTEARVMYEKALVRFPDYYPVHRNLGILCDLYLNDPACALEHYEIYSQVKPEDQQVRIWIADLQARGDGL